MLVAREAGSRKQYGLPPGTLDSGMVAAHFGVSQPTLQRWRKTGLLPQPEMLVGRKLLWSESVLAEVEANMKAAATAHFRLRALGVNREVAV